MMGEESEARLATLERQMKRLLSDRSIGAALDGSFALKWPSRVMGPEGDTYIIVRQPGGLLSSVPISTYNKDGWTDGSYWDSFPLGTIWQYEGTEADIPSGWFICDGNNGTPDLTDKFILGGTLETAGTESAGTATVIADHVVTQPTAHVVTQPTAHGSNTVTADIADTGSGTTVMTSYGLTNNHVGTAVDAHSGTAVDAHTVTTDYSPPYYQLAFIKRVA